jgi:hypothetical protein
MAAVFGLGTYGNGVGVVTPADHKFDQAGQVVKTSTGAVRAGLFWAGNPTIITGKANMSYDVAAFQCVTTRGFSSGAVFAGNDGVVNVVTTAAPGSNSRIDIIYFWPREFSLDGVNSIPVIGVVQGTAAATPAAPSLAAFPGAIELGRATVPAGITATTSAIITQTAPFTTMDGGRIPARSAADVAALGSGFPVGALAEDKALGVGYRFNGASWVAQAGGVVIPSSVVGGTLDAATGVTTFTGASVFSLNNCFPDAEKHYELILEITTMSAAVQVRLRAGGVDASGTATYFSTVLQAAGGGVASSSLNSSACNVTFSASASEGGVDVKVFSPRSVRRTRMAVQSVLGSGAQVVEQVAVMHSVAAAYDGVSVFASSGTFTGNARVVVVG